MGRQSETRGAVVGWEVMVAWARPASIQGCRGDRCHQGQQVECMGVVTMAGGGEGGENQAPPVLTPALQQNFQPLQVVSLGFWLSDGQGNFWQKASKETRPQGLLSNSPGEIKSCQQPHEFGPRSLPSQAFR